MNIDSLDGRESKIIIEVNTMNQKNLDLRNPFEYNTTKRKLHVTIPTELWGIIFAKQDMAQIDEIVTELLCKYYGVVLYNHKKE